MSEKLHKYYPESVSGFAKNATKNAVLNDKNLTDAHIENLCDNFLTNRIYADVVEGAQTFEQGREKSFEIAAQVVVNHGEKIKAQLDENDKVADDRTPSSSIETSQPNTSEDIKKISGGTMAHIIKKVAEILATMSPEEQSSVAQNISALFAVVGKSFDKTATMMQELVKTPVVVASLKNVLKGTEGEEVFSSLTAGHLNPAKQKAVNKVSQEDLKNFAKEIAQRQNQTGFGTNR